MPKLTAFLGALAPKFGVDITAHLAALAENDIDLPDELANPFTTKDILTEESARNNPKIKAYFTSQSLNTVDATLDTLMADHGFTEDQQQAVKKAQGTYERQRVFAKIMAESKTTPPNNDEVTRLNTEIVNLKRQHQEQLSAKDSEYQKNIHNFTLDKALSKRRLDEDKFGSLDLATDFAKIQLDKALAEKGIIKVFDPTTQQFKLKQAANPEMDYFVDNSPAQFETFLDQLLADKKILKINDPVPTPQPVTPGNIPPNRQPGQFSNNGFASQYDDALREFQQGSH